MTEAMARINPNAARIADEMCVRAGELGVTVHRLRNGARLVDAGVEAPGSHGSGRLFAEACLGGLGRVSIAARALGDAVLPEARVEVDLPLISCMASQYAGWQVKVGKFFGMGSGPARALAAVEPLFERLGLSARSDRTVLLLETSSLPTEEVADLVSGKCGLPPDRLTLVVASTGSLTGSTQIAARSVETALHKLMEIGFDLSCIRAGTGVCPIAPGIPDAIEAIGRTNDAMLYGGEVSLWVYTGDREIEAVLDKVPSSSSPDYGRLFSDLYREQGDFYSIDPMLFSPARVTFINAASGRVFSRGRPDRTILMRSFGINGDG